jgi:cell division protein FtsL
MSLDLEYAIKKDIRNNPVVREVDEAQKKEFLRTSVLAGLIVLMLIFSVWQHAKIVRHGYLVAQLQRVRAIEESQNRALRLEVETWRAPSRIETRAVQELHMVQPTEKNTIMIDLTPASAPTRSIVAQIR